MKKTTLYSTREAIRPEIVDFLSKAPEGQDREQCEKDIYRTQLYIGSYKFTNNTEIRFELAQNQIAEVIKEKFPEISPENKEYFSNLMPHLCHQSLPALPLQCLKELDLHGGELSMPIAESLSQMLYDTEERTNMKVQHSIKCEEDKVVFSYRTPLFYGTTEDPKYATRTIKYTFYPDKTMQMSMENPRDDMEVQGEKYFVFLTSMTPDQFVAIQDKALEDYKKTTNRSVAEIKEAKDKLEKLWNCESPYNLLAMNCDQEQCRRVTAIEKLRKANPETMARLVSQYIKNSNVKDLDIPQDIYEKLSPETQNNIKNIATKLQERVKKNEIILVIEDLINIVINYFLSIMQFKSVVTPQEFDEFCSGNQKNEESNEESTFANAYLALKDSITNKHTV